MLMQPEWNCIYDLLDFITIAERRGFSSQSGWLPSERLDLDAGMHTTDNKSLHCA